MKDLRRRGFAVQQDSDSASGPGAWRLPLFCGLPALLGPLTRLAALAGGAGMALQYVLSSQALGSRSRASLNLLPARQRRIQ